MRLSAHCCSSLYPLKVGRALQPYNYQATPAVIVASKAPSSTGVFAPAAAKTAAPASTAAYPHLSTSTTGRVGPGSNASSYTSANDNALGGSTGSAIGRNTSPGTYNPRKF